MIKDSLGRFVPCQIHNRRSPTTGRCLDCQKINAQNYRDKVGNRTSRVSPTPQIAAALASWR
jgi:hypothetical protein